MNPLGSLPASNSAQFTLNTIDWLKVLRILLVQLLGLFVTYAPVLSGYHYVVMGQDITPVVLILINTALELARRFLAQSK